MPKTPPKIINFGCRLNHAEGAVIERMWHDNNTTMPDNAIIVNSCAVTNETERQVRQKIRSLKRHNDEANIIVTGCAAQINPTTYSAMDEVDKVIGNNEKFIAESYQKNEALQVRDIMHNPVIKNNLHGVFKDNSRAFIEIQNGCNHRCTFCIIPYGRGNARSYSIEQIIDTCQKLVDDGYHEIILSGVDLTSWGADLDQAPTLGQLIAAILRHVPQLKRLRLSSLDVAEIDDLLLEQIANQERLMPHIHLSLQAGDDLILKRMKRRHSRQQAIDIAHKLRQIRPNIALGADIICGFPTEDDAMFEQTCRMVQDIGLEHIHIFPYSAKIGTPAAKIPDQIPIKERKRRVRHLHQIQHDIANIWRNNLVGHHYPILLENHQQGLTPHYARVTIEGHNHNMVGQVVPVTITHHDDGRLSGTITPAAHHMH